MEKEIGAMGNSHSKVKIEFSEVLAEAGISSKWTKIVNCNWNHKFHIPNQNTFQIDIPSSESSLPSCFSITTLLSVEKDKHRELYDLSIGPFRYIQEKHKLFGILSLLIAGCK